MIPTSDLSNAAVRTFVEALNSNDQGAFANALTVDATMSDDGSDRDLADWTEREIFSSSGHLDVESENDDGLGFVAMYQNSRWGAMRTAWQFTESNGKISRFETGQA